MVVHDKELSLYLDHIALIEVIILIFQESDLSILFHLIDLKDLFIILSSVPHEIKGHWFGQKVDLNSTYSSSVKELVQILKLQKLLRIHVCKHFCPDSI